MTENYNGLDKIKDTNIQNFKNELHKGIVEFKYKKKDGSIRDAKGTLNINIMGNENAPTSSGHNVSDTNIRYYDLNSNGWRSFIYNNLLEWNKI